MLRNPIAQGRTAEIYPWEEGWIVKLFHEWFPRENIRYEAQIARIVHDAGLPVPEVGEVVKVEERLGLIYERVDGPTMLEEINAEPWRIWRSARLLADLHAEIHARDASVELPSQRERLEEKIAQARGLSPGLQKSRLSALDEMPQGGRLCHGDFHPGNVVITMGGPVVIDWIDATLGNPMADVARTALIHLGIKWLRRESRLQVAIIEWFHRIYMRRYFALGGGKEEEYRAWYPITAAARMSEGITELEAWLQGEAEFGLRSI